MCILFEKIEALCNERGIKVATLAKDTGLSKTLFSDLKHGKSKSLSLDKLIIIADYFDISLDELVGRKKRTPTTKAVEAENEIIDLFKSMDKKKRELFIALAKELILQG